MEHVRVTELEVKALLRTLDDTLARMDGINAQLDRMEGQIDDMAETRAGLVKLYSSCKRNPFLPGLRQ